jgi:hypothetical protein
VKAELQTWRPASLPDGWHVRQVSVYDDARAFRIVRRYDVELVHAYTGWSFRIETTDPSAIDEHGLVALLNALTSANIGAVVRVSADWDSGRW